MNRLYNVTIEYLGMKKQDKFPQSTICLGKDGAFLVMDEEGNGVRCQSHFVESPCRVAKAREFLESLSNAKLTDTDEMRKEQRT